MSPRTRLVSKKRGSPSACFARLGAAIAEPSKRTMPREGARLWPLVTLATLSITLIVVRLARHVPVERAGVEPPRPPDASSPPGSLGRPPFAGAEKSATVPPHPTAVHGDVRRTHRARGRGPKSPEVRWTYVSGAPIVTQVVADREGRRLAVGDLSGRVSVLDRAGKRLWGAELGAPIYGAPTWLDRERLIVGVDGGALVCLRDGGERVWKLDLDADVDTAPAITEDGRIVVAAGAHVLATDATGRIVWRYRAPKKVFTAPAIGKDGPIVVGSQDGSVIALGEDGALLWRTELGADVDGGPAITDDGAIIVGTDAGEIVRLTRSGEVTWRRSVGGYVRGPISVGRDGDVLSGVYGPTPRVVRVGPGGQLLGSFAVQGTGAKEFGIHGGPLEDADGTLYFGAQDDRVYAIERSGRQRWLFRTGGDVDAPLTLLEDGTLVVPSADGRVYALGGKAGATAPTSGRPAAPPSRDR